MNLTETLVGAKLWSSLMKGKAHVHAFVSHVGAPSGDHLKSLYVQGPVTKKVIRNRELRAPR